jgi:hypothetical protein
VKAYSVTSREELGKNAVKEFNLSRGTNNLFIDISTRTYPVLNALEQERMLANLPKLHKLVRETFNASRFPLNIET